MRRPGVGWGDGCPVGQTPCQPGLTSHLGSVPRFRRVGGGGDRDSWRSPGATAEVKGAWSWHKKKKKLRPRRRCWGLGWTGPTQKWQEGNSRASVRSVLGVLDALGTLRGQGACLPGPPPLTGAGGAPRWGLVGGLGKPSSPQPETRAPGISRRPKWQEDRISKAQIAG